MSTMDELVDIEYVSIVRETDLAVQYQINDDLFDPQRVWIPKSQIEDECEEDDGSGTITIPEWLAIEKRLI